MGAATVRCDLGLVKGIIIQSQRMDFLPILKMLNTIERSGSDGLMDKDKTQRATRVVPFEFNSTKTTGNDKGTP